MFLSSEELKLFYIKTQFYSTKKLHKLEYYLRYNKTYPIHNQMHEVVEMLLIERGEHNSLHQRIKEINYLDKCFSLSNPFGRLSARLIGYTCKFIDKKKY